MSLDDTADFDTPALGRVLDSLDRSTIDALPFGVILLDDAGGVVYFSEAERRLSGSHDLARIGQNFFTDIAPCMDNPDFRGRIERARSAGTLDIEFTHVGDFADRDRELTVRVQSAAEGGIWLCMRRES